VGVPELGEGSLGCRTATHKQLYWRVEAAHSKFHCPLTYILAVFGRSEEMWVCALPVLVGAANGS
jgi:hypothetical protein